MAGLQLRHDHSSLLVGSPRQTGRPRALQSEAGRVPPSHSSSRSAAPSKASTRTSNNSICYHRQFDTFFFPPSRVWPLFAAAASTPKKMLSTRWAQQQRRRLPPAAGIALALLLVAAIAPTPAAAWSYGRCVFRIARSGVRAGDCAGQAPARKALQTATAALQAFQGRAHASTERGGSASTRARAPVGVEARRGSPLQAPKLSASRPCLLLPRSLPAPHLIQPIPIHQRRATHYGHGDGMNINHGALRGGKGPPRGFARKHAVLASWRDFSPPLCALL